MIGMAPARVCAAVATFLALCGAQAAGASTPPELLVGVARIAAPGVPGPMCVYGRDADAVAVGGAGGDTRLPVVASGRWGEGRVIAFGHDGYFGRAALETADTGALLTNSVRWAGRGDAPGLAVVGRPELSAWLREQGFVADDVGFTEIAGHDVVLFVPWNQSDDELAAVRHHVQRGGGLVVAATGWGWAQLHPALDLRLDFAGNRLLAPAGIQWPNDWLSETDARGGYGVDGPPSALVVADAALAAAIDHEAGMRELTRAEIAQVSRTLVAAATCAPPADPLFLPRLRAEVPDVVVPSPGDPVGPDEVLDRVAVTLQTREVLALPIDEARAHPAAEIFPGPVPTEAARLEGEVVDVPTDAPDWYSTGLYAPAGEVIRVALPAAFVSSGLGLRISAHTDRLWHVAGNWTRMPEISHAWPLDAESVRVFSPFGGLIYVTVPRGLDGTVAKLTIDGAVRAPVYRLGDDVDTWRVDADAALAPWGEIVGANMIVTAPAHLVRQAVDPAGVVAAWDRLLDLAAELGGQPNVRARPERFVADQQISAGYMHSGYPLMCHLDQAGNLVDAAHLTTEGNWGFFHEVGHNHQRADWTFQGTVEVTVNLFTLYVYEHLVGRPPLAHERGSVEFVRQQMAKYDFDQPDFAQWKSDPFLALAMYAQLQHAFGWEAYRAVFAEYRDLPDAERPTTDDAKRDQWLVRFSREVGRDLGPFFEAWGVPTSGEARASLSDLPAWMPSGFPSGYDLPPTATPAATATSTVPPQPTPTSTAPPQPTPTSIEGRSVVFLPSVLASHAARTTEHDGAHDSGSAD